MGKWKWTMWLAAVFAFCLSETVFGAGSPVSMTITPVYGDCAQYGGSVPLTVQLYGQSEMPFSGTVHALTLESSGDGGEETFEYVWPVQVKPAETKKMELSVPLGQKSNRIYMTLQSDSGQVLSEETLNFDVSRDMGRLFIGTLSDHPENLQWLDGIGLNYGMVESVLLPLSEKNLPSRAQGLELLDVLLINDYDASLLSKQQREAVLSWVEQGGILLFGTGADGDESFDVLAGEKAHLVPEKSGIRQVDMGDEYARERPGDALLSLYCAGLQIPEGEKRLQTGDFSLLTMVQEKEGYFGFFPVDLGELAEFASENSSYGLRLLTALLGEDEIYDLYYYGSYSQDTDYWNAQNLVTGGNADRIPNVAAYTIVVILYIGLAGPGLYLILRKRQLGRYYGLAVVITSLVSCGVIYMMGTGTRFTREFSTYASVLDLDVHTAEETTYLNIRTPDSRSFSVSLEPEYEVRALTRSSRYDEVPAAEFKAGSRPSTSLSFGEETVIRSTANKAFESHFFRLDRQVQMDGDRGLRSSLEVFDGKVSGYVENGFPFALENAALFFYGQVLPLGSLEPGEVRWLQDEELFVWPVGMPYLVAGDLVEADGTETDDESEAIRTSERSGFYSYFINRYFGTFSTQARFSAFGPAGGLRDNPSHVGQSDGLVIYTAALNVSNEKNGLVYENGLKLKPRMTTGSGMAYGNSMMIYGDEPVTVEYFFGENLEIEKLDFLPVSDRFLDEPDYSYIRRFSGETSFYNQATEVWEPVNLQQCSFSAQELSDYLTPEGSLLVKYSGGEIGTSGISQVIPLVMATGRER
ncbi:MAG TPA: hypothetical protein IAB28_08770 [Candidatus Copromonas faecavium]|uniref:DUF4350 domain-containing protein n=1 Tax=Candidatus Copromonas faecavium (nom. illeg.) TaxID=2840740 RepID=A0A9D1A6T4_9FIRM|nr:hypothetical protein [Candidatus Copromonas faecavium]